MISSFVLQEEEFALCFLTANAEERSPWHAAVHDAVGDDGVVLQERIIAPSPHVADAELNSGSAGALIVIGNEHLPMQWSAIILKPCRGQAVITKLPFGSKVSAGGITVFFSNPINSPPDSDETSYYSTFASISEILAAAEMRESDLVRTWLYAQNILADYEMLNSARDRYFKGWYSSRNTFLPASTGIQAITPQGGPLSIDFCAFSGKDIEIRQIPSPMQNEPIQYHKLFSRAIEVSFPANQLLFISGTASIDQKGESVHAGDFPRQMHQILEVIQAILQEQKLGFANIVQAIVYLQRNDDLVSCMQILDASGFPRHRCLILPDTDICRPELLCEIEVITVKKRMMGG